MAEFLARFWTKMRAVSVVDAIDGTEVLPVVHTISTRYIRVDQIVTLALARFRAVPVVAPLMPTGTVCATFGPVPAGWLKCDGALVSRSLYPALFAVIGTAHGAGDAHTTFQLPDIKTRLTLGNKPDATWMIAL